MFGRKIILFIASLATAISIISCQAPAEIVISGDVETVLTQLSQTETNACDGKFVRHELDHITTNVYEPVDMYDSNGAGLALNDLDNDGDIDIVLANLADDNQILWNDGELNFRSEALSHGNSRGVATVDVDADGLLDIVFATRVGTLVWWHNQGGQKFERKLLPGVGEFAYAMAWDDLDGDGDLDLVTGSYDTALEKELRDSFMFGDGAGVFYFENLGGEFVGERLAAKSQALAIQLMDINMDSRKDILVGNDFSSMRDYQFLRTETGWLSAEPLDTTTENTMSFDVGDVNNDGTWELFAADMHPYEGEDMAAWEPVMETMMANHTFEEGNPQVMANVLQVQDVNGTLNDRAPLAGVDATGWSWSSKFGDLDQDGFIDLYSVNGMASAETFGHLPDFTLVEENQALRNDGTGRFERVSEWGLGDLAGGRSMSMADLDNDGDLDIVINNLLANATVFENQLCSGESLLVDLRWPNSANPFAIGSVVTIETDFGRMMRDVRVSSGYLSGDATQLHFGLPEKSKINQITITWPDGKTTTLNNVQAEQALIIERQ